MDVFYKNQINRQKKLAKSYIFIKFIIKHTKSIKYLGIKLS
jgi:hypothetical protein